MKLLTKDIERKLIQQFEQEDTPNKKPYLKLFGGSSATWLISEYNKDEGMYFGLCDLGLGTPELGYVSKDEIEALRCPPFGLPVERDRFFEPKKTLTEYATDARTKGSIVD